MTDNSIDNLVETRKRVIIQVNQKELSVDLGAQILGMSRQGLWKLKKQVAKYGWEALTGLKRGPKPYQRAWNKTPVWMEDTVEKLFNLYSVGPDRQTFAPGSCFGQLHRCIHKNPHPHPWGI